MTVARKAVSVRLSPQQILDKLMGRPVRAVKHPAKGIVSALKRFMNLRDQKMAKQTAVSKEPTRVTAGDHLAASERARHLAWRLADPAQVAIYISELHQEADARSESYWRTLNEVKNFWYGPAGLEWLARKKNVGSWGNYTEFMDAAAKEALLPQPDPDPVREAKEREHFIDSQVRRAYYLYTFEDAEPAEGASDEDPGYEGGFWTASQWYRDGVVKASLADLRQQNDDLKRLPKEDQQRYRSSLQAARLNYRLVGTPSLNVIWQRMYQDLGIEGPKNTHLWQLACEHG